jgi:aminopeptidase N
MGAGALAIGAGVLLAAAGQPDGVPTGRLSGDVTPVAYRLDLREDPEQPRFRGHVEIDVRLAHPAHGWWINGHGLRVSQIEVRSADRTTSASYAEARDTGVARITTADEVASGPATLVIDYDAPFADGTAGLYKVQAGGRWYSYSNFEPIDARSAFPCFDQPGFKTPFTISVTLPAGLSAVSNAAEIAASPASDGWVTHRFAATLPLPTYLVAFMAGPFATVAGAVAPNAHQPTPLPLRIVATAPQADKLAFASRETGPIVSLLEDYFGQAFPFPKLDQIATPAWSGETAMENAGADTYADRVLLLGANATTTQRRSFGMVVAHELSHQWFGDLVTPAWWDDLWLNESFANWMGYRIGNAWRPDLRIGSGAVAEGFEAMDLDALLAGRPIRQPIAQAEDADGAFDQVTYGKGGQVVAQTAAYLGDDTFRDGVRLHLSRHRYANATSDQFFQALSDAAHDPEVAASMRSFVDQQGVPLVTFARAGNGWTATQSRYALLGETPVPTLWTLPLCVHPIGGSQRCAMMTGRTMALGDLGPRPFVPNAQGTGYYRFELPAADWPAVVAELGGLSAAEALAVDDSLWASFAAGRAAPALLIEAARRLAANAEGGAVLDGASRLAAWRRHGLIGPDKLAAYRQMMASLYGARLLALGWDLRAGAFTADDPDRRALREGLAAIMAEEARDPVIRSSLATAAARYLAGDKGALDDGFLASGLTVYVQEHDLGVATRLLGDAVRSDDPVFRLAATQAVGAGAPVATAQEATALIFGPGLPTRTRSGMAQALLARPDSRAAAQVAVLPRLAEFGRYIPSLAPAGELGSFDEACSAGDAAAIGHALRQHTANIRGGALSIDRIVERINTCAMLETKRAGEVGAALSRAS